MITVIGLLALFTVWGIVSARREYYARTDDPHIFQNVTIAAVHPTALADFYIKALGCEIIPADGGFELPGESSAIVMRLPGYRHGPTLRIIPCSTAPLCGPLEVYDRGYAHLCFETDDVPGLVQKAVQAGATISSTFDRIEESLSIYTKDPEGNTIEVHLPLPAPFNPYTFYRALKSAWQIKRRRTDPERSNVRFIHVNIISENWQETAEFYRQTIHARPTGMKRDYKGHLIEQMVGIKGVTVKGRHIALPGYRNGGPTFELFTYSKPANQGPPGLADRGIIATGFLVHDLTQTVAAIENAGGQIIRRAGNGMAVVTDRDRNILQLVQR